MKHKLISVAIFLLILLGGMLILGNTAQTQAHGEITSNDISSLSLNINAPEAPNVISHTYTLDADFDEGTLINVNHDAPNNDQLQLDENITTFPFIWIALSGRGTVVKVNTEDVIRGGTVISAGTILGEYRSAPEGRGLNPSRTTVDMNGNVWVGNRAEAAGALGSVVHLGLEENFQCVDRNHNGKIDTSTGLGDVLAWPNTGPDDADTAVDECIIDYERTPGTYVRHVSVDRDNNAWVGGYGNLKFSLLDGASGAPLQTAGPFGCGGYGGLVDNKGVVWSARLWGNGLLRYDPDTGQASCLPVYAYGMGMDRDGNIWVARWCQNTISKVAPDGTILFTKSTGGTCSRGVAVTFTDNNVWVANSSSNTVTRLDNNGDVLKTISVGIMPTGVAVDAAGKVWVTNHNSNNAMRIDPTTNKVDLTVDLGNNAQPYNYSDMTGIVALSGTAPQGTWTVIYDSGSAGTPWGKVSWHSHEPTGTLISVRARSAEMTTTLGSASYVTVANGIPINRLPHGRYLQVQVKFRPNVTKTSPILYDLTVEAAPPPCKVVQDKTAFPKVAQVGNAVTVTLAMNAVGQCSFEGSPVDAVLVLDRSGSMGNKDGTNTKRLEHAQDAASLFVDQMQLPPDRVGIVSFASSGRGTLDIGLTDNVPDVKNAIGGLVASGMTDMEEGLELAEAELLANGRAPNVPIIIILSDGHHNESQPGELLDTADRIKRAGIRIISIGVGAANEGQLKAIASSTDDYYYAPDAADLADIYREIAPTVRVAGRNVVLTDTVSSFATLIPNTFQGPVTPTVNGDEIVWRLAGIPVKGVTLTYQIAMTSTAGTWDTNDSAIATYIDSNGDDAALIFPVPQVIVPVVCPNPQIKDVEPIWACVDDAVDPLKILGSGFITLTEFTSITGTFGVDANVGVQALGIHSWTHELINGALPANNGLVAGMHDVIVTNTCVLSTVIPGGSSHPTPTIVPIPPETKSVVLADGFRLYGPPHILSVRPPEGYNDIPTDLTICGEGFAPGAEVFLEVPTGTIKLSDQATYGDTCLVGTVPAGLAPGDYDVIVQGPCGEDRAMFRVLDAGRNDDLWAQPEKLWVNPSICVRECDEDISMGLIVNRRGGKESLQNVIVRFYEGNPQDPQSVVIGDGVIPLLSPRVSPVERIGGFSTLAVTWIPSSGVMSYTLYAVIDPDGNIEEDVEDNNTVSRTVQVLPCDPQFDGVAPHVDSFEIARGRDVVHDPEVDLHVTATDFAQRGIIPSGISQMYFVEYLFNKATEIWVPVGSSGWMTFSENSTWSLYPQGGLRFIQAWASEKLANVSRYPYQQQVNYIQPCDAVSRDSTRTYRRHLKPGDIIYVEVAPCKGDPDLYIWPPDWEDGNPAWVSNLYHDDTEFLSVTVSVSGVYQVEVYGYTNAYYNINIETEPGPANVRMLTSHAPFATAGESDKPQHTAPTLTPDSLPSVIMGVPPAPSGQFPASSDVNIQGPRQTWVDVSTTFTATLLPTIVAPVTYTWEATGQAVAYDTVNTGAGSTHDFTWDMPGVKTITVTASTSAGASVHSTYTTTVSISPPRSVDVAGESTGTVDTAYTFTATVKPGTATMPLTYTWEATDQLTPTVHAGVVNYRDTMSFTWTMASTKTITVTVDNGVDTPAVGNHTIMITQKLRPTTRTSSTLTSADQDIIIDFPEPMITETIDFTITPTVPFTWTWIYGRRAPLMGPTGAMIHHDPFTPNITYTLSLLPGAKTVTGKDVVATDFFFRFEMQGYTVYLPLVLKRQ